MIQRKGPSGKASSDVVIVVDSLANLRLIKGRPSTVFVEGDGFWDWNPASVVTDTGNASTTAVEVGDEDVGRYERSSTMRANGSAVKEFEFPTESMSVAGNVATGTGIYLRNRSTELDNFVLGKQGSSGYTRHLLSEATVICPLLGRDRYWDTSDSTWRSRNYGLLGGGAILGNATQAQVQLPYTDSQKGCRLLAQGGVGMIQLPAAWINADSAFTVLIRYQRPTGYNVNYAQLFQIGDVGGGNGTARVHARVGTTDTLLSSVGALNVPASTYNPRVLVISAATAANGAVTIYRDGANPVTGTKLAGTLSGANHSIGGFFNSGTAYGYAHFNILDIIVIPRQLTADEVAWLTRAVQFPDTPNVDLLSGQSNMMGSGNINNGEICTLPTLPNARVSFCDNFHQASWNSGWGPCNTQPYGGFGPELTICALRPNRTYVKYGRGGTSSWGWIELDSAEKIQIADGLMRSFAQLSCKPVVKNFVFRQGETDAEIAPGTMTPEYRRDRLISVIAQVRTGFNRTAAELRAVIARVPQAISTFPSIVSLANVRAGDALFVAQDANARLVDTDACAVRANDLHNTNQGALDVGTLCAAQMQD